MYKADEVSGIGEVVREGNMSKVYPKVSAPDGDPSRE